MKSLTITGAILLGALTVLNPAHSDEPPIFIQETFPEQGVEAAWQGYQSVFIDPEGALDARTKELIALAVSAQIPCDYCIYYHTEAAQAQGASEAQIKEALASAALVRKWSTMLNGSQYDMTNWKAQVEAMFSQE